MCLLVLFLNLNFIKTSTPHYISLVATAAVLLSLLSLTSLSPQQPVVTVRVMNFLGSIKGLKKKEEENECYRAPAAPMGFFQDLSTGNSSVYSFGMAFYGRLGDGQQSADKSTPEKIDCLEKTKVKSVHIESAHTLILLHSGDILSFGKCHFGQLGLGYEWMEAFCPQHIPLKVRICSLATGTHHSLAVSDQGTLYSWGCGYNGCLGHGDEHMRSSPTLVEALSEVNVMSVAGGEYHSLATVQRGGEMGQQVYSWGKGHQGQLGHANFDSQSLPQAVESLQNIRIHKIVAAANFSCALFSPLLSDVQVEGEAGVGVGIEEDHPPQMLFTWGSNSCGQLGHSSQLSHIILSSATLQEISSGMVKDEKEKGVHTPMAVVHPGFPATETVTNCKDKDDDKEASKDKTSPTSCFFWTDIASGGQHCLAVDNAGHLFAWGHVLPYGSSAVALRGECSCSPSLVGFEAGGEIPVAVPVVVSVACGTRHSLAFTAAGECFVAGSNSNGQLGLGGDTQDSHQGFFTRLDPGLFQGGAVLTGDGGTNSSVLLVSNQV